MGRLVFAPGKTPTRDGVPAYRDRARDDLGIEEGYAAARLVALSCIAELGAVCGDLRREAASRRIVWYSPKPWRIPGLSCGPEAGTQSVRLLVRIAAAENVEALVGHDLIAWAGWSNVPEPFT